MSTIEFFMLLGVSIVIIALQCLQLVRRPAQGADGAGQLNAALEKTSERTERELRGEVQASARGTRQELAGLLAEFQRSIGAQVTGVAQPVYQMGYQAAELLMDKLEHPAKHASPVHVVLEAELRIRESSSHPAELTARA